MLKAERDQKQADLPARLDGLTDEPAGRAPSRAGAFPQLMTWAGIALFMAGAALLAARSETGAQRLARLFAPAPPVRTEPPRQVAAPDPMLLYETRRLAEQVRTLAAEREQLTERMAAMERSVGDVTASISARGEPARPVRVIEGAASPAQPPAPQPPAPQAAVPPGNAPTAAPVPTRSPALASAPPASEESTAIRTEFGVDLAGEASIEALRSRWAQLRNQHGPVLEGLRPVVAIQEGRAGMELRLVVGPLSNANAASRLCATLVTAGVNCKPAVFDGQRLALR